jgi:CYTH domain-containing protein
VTSPSKILTQTSRQLVGEIYDRYIIGTRLRLRRIISRDDVVFKLVQKVRISEADPETMKLTNFYLADGEYKIIAALPATELRKTSWNLTLDGAQLAIDVLHERLDGLLLAEGELGPDQARAPAPPFAVHDVTNDDRFSGGALAASSDVAIAKLLIEVAQRRND